MYIKTVFAEKVPPSPTTSKVRPSLLNGIWPTLELSRIPVSGWETQDLSIYMAERTLLLLLEVSMQQPDKKEKPDVIQQRTNENSTSEDLPSSDQQTPA